MDQRETSIGTLWVAPEFAPLFAAHGLRTLDDLFAVEPTRRLDKPTLPAWRERVMLELRDMRGDVQRLFVKRFQPPPDNARPRLPRTGATARSAAGVERHWVLTLGAAGIPVPRLVAFGEQIDGTRERRSALVLADVGGESLENWAAAAEGLAPPQLIHALADFVRRLHDGRFIHRDLYLCHVFLTNSNARAPELALIDLQRVMLRPWPWTRWAARELAQLDYSAPQRVAGRVARLRFLKRYLGSAPLKSRQARGMMRRIARKRARIAAHDARSRKRTGMTPMQKHALQPIEGSERS
jgi:hypothetical protein